jgi:spore coat polysaccharide biosynthesis protein SpsF
MIGAIIQARTSSTRLPGKVLLELPYGSGITVLQQVIRRLNKSEKIDTIVLATTEDKADDVIVDIASREGVSSFRGSKENVLERYYLAAKTFGLDTIVRITSDCPCIDPTIVDLVIREHIRDRADYSSTEGYPRGLDAEVFNFDVLLQTHEKVQNDYEKEHVTPYLYRNPQVFSIHRVVAQENAQIPAIRLTLDTEEDYALLCVVYDHLYHSKSFFNLYEILQLFNEKPWIKLINKKVAQKKICETLEEEIKEAVYLLDLWDLKRASSYMTEKICDAGV